MTLLRTGREGCFCKLNAVLTFQEWLEDFATPETRLIGEAIIRKEPGHEKADALLDGVKEMILREEARQRYPRVIDELSRWLDNIGRMRGHAA